MLGKLDDQTVETYGRDFKNLQKNKAWLLIRDQYENQSTRDMVAILSDARKELKEKQDLILEFSAIYKLFNYVDNVIQVYDKWLESQVKPK